MDLRHSISTDVLESILRNADRFGILSSNFPRSERQPPLGIKLNKMFEEQIEKYAHIFGETSPVIHHTMGDHSTDNFSVVFSRREHIPESTGKPFRLRKMMAIRLSYGPDEPNNPETIERLHLGAYLYVVLRDKQNNVLVANKAYCSLRWKDTTHMTSNPSEMGIKFQTGHFVDAGATLNPERRNIFNIMEGYPHPTRSTYTIAHRELALQEEIEKYPAGSFLNEKEYIVPEDEIEKHLRTRYPEGNEHYRISVDDLRRKAEARTFTHKDSIDSFLNWLSMEGRKEMAFPGNYMTDVDFQALPIFGYEHVFKVLSESGNISADDAKNITVLTMDEGPEFLEKKLYPAISYFYNKY